jgi:hypothetical protein
MEIFICLCVVFILLIIHTSWPKYVYNEEYSKLHVVDILNDPLEIDLQTGDIMFIKNCVKCSYNTDIMNNWFQYIYKNMFNSFRWYIIDQAPYTHTAVIIKLNIDGKEKPYICHMDGGMAIYDEIREKSISGNGPVTSKLNHINVCGGVIHIYRYKGKKIKKDMLKWINKKYNLKYPPSIYSLMSSNALKWSKNPNGVMACTDFVENALNNMGILDIKCVTGQSTINDILFMINKSSLYDSVPIILKNKCYNNRHFV